MGPTASGKTSLAIKLAGELDGEIISVDSALIYRGMDIGTAKPTMEERAGIVHHLIDIIDPSESYSVAAFRNDALRLIDDITSRGKMPILVGGTMLYFKAITEGLSPLPNSNAEVRAKVNAIIAGEGLPALRELVHEVDPESWMRINENDAQRLGRAYEVYLLCGHSMTEINREHGQYECPVNLQEFALLPDRERKYLKPLIAKRFDMMLENGFEAEVRALYDRGDLSPELPSIRSVGYRQMWMYLEGEVDYEKMRELSVIATCQLAKRQMTWLRGWKSSVEFLDPLAPDNLSRIMSVLKNRF
ncbi:tRNA (adenosine(37)-N6)-dimethylallyltransferase MiaA [uncultured Ruminobacter sp.]|uniref:tRNA (adenosine(37)-N6)-dimethylallyltransferase MiaA n=1 Tax=uncultured Ruminobacter sp. TaxID=538947 RepID=UPI00260823ED|nr:tRNA (adenosine(37)-N6)-dimethylallyltransferase MiaA [uncultured Ruminobacter sp.]